VTGADSSFIKGIKAFSLLFNSRPDIGFLLYRMQIDRIQTSVADPGLFLSSRKYDPGYSSRIPVPDLDFVPIPDPGVKKAPDLDPQH
jgi:hypothetical protein